MKKLLCCMQRQIDGG